MRGKRILITGGLGFIGSSIALQCVSLGADVTLLDACLEPYGWNFANIDEIKNSVLFIKEDVRNQKRIEEIVFKSDIVYHMAAQVGREISMENPDLDAEINCLGTLHVLEAARKMETPPVIVYAGSRGQTGEPISLPVDENHPDNPTDIYGINKLAAEKYLFLYHKVYGLPVVSLRLNNVYGPRCQMHAGFYGILNWFMSKAMQGEAITVYGDGSQTRDYVYIDDVADAFIRASLTNESIGEMFYVGSGVETVFMDMVNEIVHTVGRGKIVHIPFPEAREKIDIRRFVVSTEKIHLYMGWKPMTNLVEGIGLTYRFYETRLDKYLRKEKD
jgi:UDP-glucose 4-epimerase